MLPSEIEKRFPDKWKNDEDEGGKNMFGKISLLIGKRLEKEIQNILTLRLQILILKKRK